jgi:anti-sigma-K factor RskA
LEAKEIISSGILELYATGLASAAEVKQVQLYITRYPEVAAELEQIEAGMELYAQAHGVEPNSTVKDKIFARIERDETAAKVLGLSDHPANTPSKVVRMVRYWKFATAASVALLLGSIALNMLMYNKNISTAKNLEQTQQELAGLKEENKLMAGDMEVVQSKYSQPVALHGLEAAPSAAAKIFWMANTGEVYIDPSNLPDAPSGKQYQLWAIVDGKPIDGGMILTSKKGDKFRIQKMKTFGKAEAFAVTLEDNGGNVTPKGPMFVMGKM